MLASTISLITTPFSTTLFLLHPYSKIYTKTGDNGKTGLVSGLRKSKDQPIFHLLGDIDELNSYLGIVSNSSFTPLQCNSLTVNKALKESLNGIQNHLYHISAYLATQNQRHIAKQEIVKKLEEEIDKMTEQLSPLRNLIQPGGTVETSHLHYARTISRRVERRYVSYSKHSAPHKDLMEFFNRLSDYLFVSARYANHLQGVGDVISV